MMMKFEVGDLVKRGGSKVMFIGQRIDDAGIIINSFLASVHRHSGHYVYRVHWIRSGKRHSHYSDSLRHYE